MTTTKSYSSKSRFASLYRSALKRHVPIIIVLTIIFLLIVLVPFCLEVFDPYYSLEKNVRYMYDDTFGVLSYYPMAYFVQFIMVAMGIIGALYSTGYIHSRRQVDLYHSLPVSRPHLITANMLATVTAVMGSYIAVCLVAMAIQIPIYAATGYLRPGYFQSIAVDILLQLLCLLVSFLFTAFISVNVGTVFDSLATTLSLGFAPMFVYLICGWIWSDALYGASFDPEEYVLLLSPFTFIFYQIEFIYDYCGMVSVPFYQLILYILGALAAAVIFYCATIFFYNLRRSEVAGLTQHSGVFQTIVKCFASFVGAVLFYGLFQNASIIGLLIAMLIGALVVGLIAELILSRGVRYIVKNIKWLAGTGAACGLLLLITIFDLTGYQARVPADNQVTSVAVSYRGHYKDTVGYYTSSLTESYGNTVTLTAPESIAILTGSHRQIVQNIPDRSDRYRSDRNYLYASLQLEYTLKSGRTMKRYYYSLDRDAYLQLAQLEAQQDFIMGNHPLFLNEDQPIAQAKLVSSIYYYDALGNGPYGLSLTESQKEMLLSAMRRDMLAESFEEMIYPEQPVYGFLELSYRYPTRNSSGVYSYENTRSQSACVPVNATYGNTKALLEEFGLEPGIFLSIDQLEAAYVYQLSSTYTSANRIVTITPDETGSFQPYIPYYELENEDYGFTPEELEEIYRSSSSSVVGYTTVGAEIMQLYQCGKNQILSRSSQYEYDEEYYGITFYANGMPVGAMFVRYEDLPAGMQAQIRASLVGAEES